MKWADLVGVERNGVSFLVTVVGGVRSDMAGAGEEDSSDKKEKRRRCPHCVFCSNREIWVKFFFDLRGERKMEEITIIFIYQQDFNQTRVSFTFFFLKKIHKIIPSPTIKINFNAVIIHKLLCVHSNCIKTIDMTFETRSTYFITIVSFRNI